MILRSFLIFLIFFLPPFVSAEEGFIVETLGKSPYHEARKSLIEKVLRADAMEFGYSALRIVLDAAQKEPRGKMQGHLITLSATVVKESEFLKLLVHEVAHYIDIYSLSSILWDGIDPSGAFYSVSWSDKTTKKPGQTLSDFISGYAATNQFEDFAETFTFYVFHNEEFADRALRSDALRQKYVFLSKVVFPNGEFEGTDFGIGKVPSYLWDTTKLPVSVKKYLYSLR
jgi:hypothetical protein